MANLTKQERVARGGLPLYFAALLWLPVFLSKVLWYTCRWQSGKPVPFWFRRFVINHIEGAPVFNTAIYGRIFGPWLFTAVADKARRRKMSVWMCREVS